MNTKLYALIVGLVCFTGAVHASDEETKATLTRLDIEAKTNGFLIYDSTGTVFLKTCPDCVNTAISGTDAQRKVLFENLARIFYAISTQSDQRSMFLHETAASSSAQRTSPRNAQQGSARERSLSPKGSPKNNDTDSK